MKTLAYIIVMGILISCKPLDISPPAATPISPPAEQPEPSSKEKMKITIGNSTFTATFALNATAKAFKAILPLTLTMSDFNSNEKVVQLSNSITTSTTNPKTIFAGDIMLYGNSSLVLFYETFSTPYSYSRIAKIDNSVDLKATLGRGNVTVKFEIAE